MEQPFLSLVIIHRHAQKSLPRLLESLATPRGECHVDEIVLVDTGPADDPETRFVCEDLEGEGLSLSNFPYLLYAPGQERIGEVQTRDGRRHIADFARARNYAHALALGRWHLMLDADDVLLAPEHRTLKAWLRELLLEFPYLSAVALPYEYGVGGPQWRTRLWNEAYTWRWFGALHEKRLPPDGSKASVLRAEMGYQVEHVGDPSSSLERNRLILEHVPVSEYTLEMRHARAALERDPSWLEGQGQEVLPPRARDLLATLYRAEAGPLWITKPEGLWAPVYLAARQITVPNQEVYDRLLSFYRGEYAAQMRAKVQIDPQL